MSALSRHTAGFIALPTGMAERRGGREHLGDRVICAGDGGLPASGAVDDRPVRRPHLAVAA